MVKCQRSNNAFLFFLAMLEASLGGQGLRSGPMRSRNVAVCICIVKPTKIEHNLSRPQGHKGANPRPKGDHQQHTRKRPVHFHHCTSRIEEPVAYITFKRIYLASSIAPSVHARQQVLLFHFQDPRQGLTSINEDSTTSTGVETRSAQNCHCAMFGQWRILLPKLRDGYNTLHQLGQYSMLCSSFTTFWTSG